MSQLLCLYHLDGQAIAPSRCEQALAQTPIGQTAATRQWRNNKESASLIFAHICQETSSEDHLDRPWVSPNQQQATIADARLYNRPELAEKLAIPRARLAELPNAALIHAAYEKWGSDCPQYLLGDFVFLIWDRKRQQLFCARDHSGAYMLFFARKGNAVAVATAPKFLFPLLALPRRLNRRATAEFLCYIEPPEQTLFEHVHRLPAGHTLTVNAKGLQLRRYWTPETIPTLQLGKDEDYIEAFQELFDQAVGVRLATDGDTAILLSGGLDSNAVAATAAPLLEQRQHKLIALTSVPRKIFRPPAGSRYLNDEGPLAAATAKRFANLEIHYLHGGERSPLQDMEGFLDTIETPMRSILNRPWLEKAIEQTRDRGIKVILSGSAGNHTISWSGETLLLDQFLHGHWVDLVTELRALAKTSQVSAAWLFKRHVLRPLLPPPFLHVWRRLHKINSTQAWQQVTCLNRQTIDIYQLETRYAKYHGLDLDIPWTDSRKWRWHLLQRLANNQGANIMNSWRHRYGVEARDPTADKRIVEFCLSLPGDQYLRNGLRRRLVRKTMHDRLPTEVLKQTRTPNQSSDWYETLSELRDELQREIALARHSDATQELIDLDHLQSLLNHWPESNDVDYQTRLDYRLKLTQGIITARFIRWVESKES